MQKNFSIFPHQSRSDCIYLLSKFELYLEHPKVETKGRRWTRVGFNVDKHPASLQSKYLFNSSEHFLVLISLEQWVGHELGSWNRHDTEQEQIVEVCSKRQCSTANVGPMCPKRSFTWGEKWTESPFKGDYKNRVGDSYLKSSRSKNKGDKYT